MMPTTRRIGSIVSLLCGILLPSLAALHPASALACNAASGHYYAVAYSGYGSTIGTGATTTTWTHWSVCNNGVDFSDEAVWIINYNNSSNALEGGFASGAGSNVPWTNGMQPYYTTNNGVNKYDDPVYLAANTYMWMAVTSAYNGVNASVTVDGYAMNPGNYTVQSPRWNYSQGEVFNNNGVWMGGGSGENFQGYWESTSRSFSTWGYNNDSADSPYWIKNGGPSVWSNGGY